MYTPLPKKIKEMISGNLVIKGTLILTITGLLTRIIGFYNRIFLSQLIGAKELGIYQLIFPLYMVAFSLSTCGNELALTKIASEYHGRDDEENVNAFFRICFVISLLLGISIAFLFSHFAEFFCANILNAPECFSCLKTICYGIPFMAMKGSIHGYFLGMERSGVHGISDFTEQSAKVLGLYILSSYICVRKHYDAAFAVWGIVIGEIIAFLYSLCAFLHFHYTKQHAKPRIHPQKNTGKRLPSSQLLRIFFKESIPLTTNRMALTTLQSIEAIMIPTVLLIFYKNSTQSLSVYGIFSGMAFPFIMFPSTITNSLSTMLLPAVSNANASLRTHYLKHLCEKSISFCLLIGIFSAITFYIFGPDIGMAFFQNKEAGIFLYQLSFLCPFIYLATTLASILNGFGLATHNLLVTMVATIIRISFIYQLIPRIGMAGYIIGLFAGYLFQSLMCMWKIEKIIPIEILFFKVIFFPACINIVLGAGIFYMYKKHLMFLPQNTPNILILLIAVGVFACIGLLPALFRICHTQDITDKGKLPPD